MLKANSNYMRNFATALSLLVCCIASSPTLSQGLKGMSEGCGRSASQPPPLIAGKTNKERWSKFFAIQPGLIGMKADSVEKALGNAKSNPSRSEMYYQIIQSIEPNRKGKLANLELSIVLKKGVVESYKVEGVYWGG